MATSAPVGQQHARKGLRLEPTTVPRYSRASDSAVPRTLTLPDRFVSILADMLERSWSANLRLHGHVK